MTSQKQKQLGNMYKESKKGRQDDKIIIKEKKKAELKKESILHSFLRILQVMRSLHILRVESFPYTANKARCPELLKGLGKMKDILILTASL